MMTVLNIKKLSKQNESFRRVVLSGKQSQVVLMRLEPGDEIGEEVHLTTDQLFFIEEGHGELHVDGRRTLIGEHELGFAPAGARHNLVNTGPKPLKIVTVYAPPVHAADLVQKAPPRLVTRS